MAEIDVSLILEWEHVSMGEAERPVAMLREVVSQTAALSGKRFEVVVAYNPDITDLDEMEKILRAGGLRDATHLDVRVEAASGHRYYALKNVGAERSRGDLVVLMDSDVIPEAGWLAALLVPFEDPSTQIATGQIFVGPHGSTWWKAFALFWPLFSLEDKPGPDTPPFKSGYHANNVAFRRDVFLAHPFRPGRRVSPNREHCDDVRASGIPVVYVPGARLLHPAPRDLDDTKPYAYSSGYDRAALRRSSLPLRLFWLLFSWLPLGLDVVRYTSKVLPAARRRAVGLRLHEIPHALAIAYLYAVLKWWGFVLTMVRPHVIPERFSTGSSLAGWSVAELSRERPAARAGAQSA